MCECVSDGFMEIEPSSDDVKCRTDAGRVESTQHQLGVAKVVTSSSSIQVFFCLHFSQSGSFGGNVVVVV